MIELLARLFIRNSRHTDDPRVRTAYGMLCSAVAITLNILLAAAKFVVGTLAGSVSITADAMNNLSDVGSGALTLVGFRLSGKKPDLEHPFGHGSTRCAALPASCCTRRQWSSRGRRSRCLCSPFS